MSFEPAEVGMLDFVIDEGYGQASDSLGLVPAGDGGDGDDTTSAGGMTPPSTTAPESTGEGNDEGDGSPSSSPHHADPSEPSSSSSSEQRSRGQTILQSQSNFSIPTSAEVVMCTFKSVAGSGHANNSKDSSIVPLEDNIIFTINTEEDSQEFTVKRTLGNFRKLHTSCKALSGKCPDFPEMEGKENLSTMSAKENAEVIAGFSEYLTLLFASSETVTECVAFLHRANTWGWGGAEGGGSGNASAIDFLLHPKAYQCMEVNARSKEKMELEVAAGHTVLWKFQTRMRDIAFAVETKRTVDLVVEKTENVSRLTRYNNCSTKAVEGRYNCKHDCLAVLTWDNVYSRFRSKQVLYVPSFRLSFRPSVLPSFFFFLPPFLPSSVPPFIIIMACFLPWYTLFSPSCRTAKRYFFFLAIP